MTNGDRFTGKVIRKTEKKLRFKLPFQKEPIGIPWEEVQSLETEEPIQILKGDGTFKVEPLTFDRDSAPTLDREDLLNPKDWRLGKTWEVKGLFNLALQFQSGNNERDDLDIDVTTRVQKHPHRYAFYGEWEEDRIADQSENRHWLSQLDYNYFLDQKVYALGELEYEADDFATLDLRSTYGLGMGYQPYDTEELSLHLEAKGLRVIEEFDEAEDEEFWGAGWEMGYEQALLNEWLKFYIRNTGVVNVEDTDKVFLNLWTGLVVPLSKSLLGITEIKGQHNSDPPEGADETDVSYRLKLGYQW